MKKLDSDFQKTYRNSPVTNRTRLKSKYSVTSSEELVLLKRKYNSLLKIESEQERTVKELKTLLDVSMGLHEARTFYDVGKVIFDNLEKFSTTNNFGGKLGIYNEEEDSYKVIYIVERVENPAPADKECKLKEVKYFSGLALRERRTIVINDNHSKFALKVDPRLKIYGPGSIIFIPLLHREKLVGLFSFAPEANDSIDNRFRDLLESIGRFISLAISEIQSELRREKEMEEKERTRNAMLESLRKDLMKSYTVEDIVSRNYKMQQIVTQIPIIAECNDVVLIEGETGTGKDLLARAIHNLSKRSQKPFVVINCATIPETLFESELFGFLKGSFTDAKKDKSGKITLAEGGTVFFDEIGDLHYNLQVKLLRLLQNSEIEPIGRLKSVKVDIRIIVATNKNLEQLVHENKFRDDLYYRLNLLKIHLPPLRERMDDVPDLIEHFIEKLNIERKGNINGVSKKVIDFLLSYPYSGNIRELENIIKRAYIYCGSGTIDMQHLDPEILNIEQKLSQLKDRAINLPRKEEIKNILTSLEMFNGKVQSAAKHLGVSRTTLWRKMKKYNLNLK